MAGFSYEHTVGVLADALRVLEDFNVYPETPKSIIVPAAVIQPGQPTIRYLGRKSEFLFEVLFVLGKASEQASRQRIAQMIGLNSPVIVSINNAFPDGGVVESTIGEVEVGDARYTSALTTVKALR